MNKPKYNCPGYRRALAGGVPISLRSPRRMAIAALRRIQRDRDWIAWATLSFCWQAAGACTIQ